MSLLLFLMMNTKLLFEETSDCYIPHLKFLSKAQASSSLPVMRSYKEKGGKSRRGGGREEG